jgi:uncharacterized cupin superfamily protein
MENSGERDCCWLDPMRVSPRLGSIYPAPFGDPLVGREKRALGDALKLTQFGVNLVTLAPVSWSSQLPLMPMRMSSFLCWKGR